MNHNQLDTLILMLNQITANNGHYQLEEAAIHIADHLKRFWPRSMKKMIITYWNEDGSELSPVSKLAVEKLAEAYPSMDMDVIA